MAHLMRDEQQLQQDAAVAAGEGEEAVLVEPKIPVAAGLEEVAAATQQVGCVNGANDGWINGATAEGRWVNWKWVKWGLTPADVQWVEQTLDEEDAAAVVASVAASVQETMQAVQAAEGVAALLPEDPNPFDTLRPVLTKMCLAMVHKRKAWPCPLSLGGLCAVERLLGFEAYHPLARCFEWPQFPRDPQYPCGGKASCCKSFSSLAALRAHAAKVGLHHPVPPDWQYQGYSESAVLHGLLLDVIDSLPTNPVTGNWQ